MKERKKMKEQIQHCNSQPIVGPCLKHCGKIATYREIDHETEGHRATCPDCGEYPASREDMDKANIGY
jgi:hypothetical protein